MATRGFLIGAAGALVVALFSLTAGPAGAAFPGENGRIVYHTYGHIYAMNPDGSGKTDLTPYDPTRPEEYHRDPAVSPDGTKIAFVSEYYTRDSGIYVMDADGSDVRRPALDVSASDPSWSPDGDELLFVSGRDHGSDPGATDIYAMRSDGSDVRRLTRDAAPESHPAWSPDGTRVAFISGGDVWVMGADGSDRTNLTAPDAYTADADKPVDWSPDGKKLLFGGSAQDGPSPSGWYTMDADGGGKAALPMAERPRGVSEYITADYSPDGEKLVVTREVTCEWDYCALDSDPYGVAYTVNLDGTGLTKINDDLDPFDRNSHDWGPLPGASQEDTVDPAVTHTRPAPGSEVRDRTPTIRATVRDETDELTKADIQLRVDGRERGFSYDAGTDRLSRATKKLSYGRHTVKVTAVDQAGNEAARAWSFRVVRR